MSEDSGTTEKKAMTVTFSFVKLELFQHAPQENYFEFMSRSRFRWHMVEQTLMVNDDGPVLGSERFIKGSAVKVCVHADVCVCMCVSQLSNDPLYQPC